MAETEYFSLLSRELQNRGEDIKSCCDDCKRECGKTPEDAVDCLANLMTIEYLLDHN